MPEQESERVKPYPTWPDAVAAAWSQHAEEFAWYASQVGEQKLAELTVARLNTMVGDQNLPPVPCVELVRWATDDLVEAGLLPEWPGPAPARPEPEPEFYLELHERGGGTKRLGPFIQGEVAAAAKRYAVHQTSVVILDEQGIAVDFDTLRPPQAAPPAEPMTEQPEANVDSGPPLLVANRFAHFVRLLPGNVFLAENLPHGGDVSKTKTAPDVARAHQFDRVAAAKAAHKLVSLGVRACVLDSRGRRVWPGR